MTYAELGRKILCMTPEQRAMDVTCFDIDKEEFFRLGKVNIVYPDDPFSDVLDIGHPTLT